MRLWLAAMIGGEAQMTTNRKPRIAVVGSNMVDLITYVNRMPARGETIEAPSFEMGHGGKGANQAIAAAKLGASVVMVTKVGDDMFADSTIKNFARFGVDTTHVERVSGRSSGVAPIHGRALGREFDTHRKGRQFRPFTRRRGARRRGFEGL
jgi:sugar/nucleoside kinase (ribokinase family)